MMKGERAQAGIEYMIIIAFVTFAIMSVLGLAVFYSGQVRDDIKLNQIENFAIQLINSAESVFFAGEPSKTTVRLSLPSGVSSVNVTDEGLFFVVYVSGGQTKRLFESRVPLAGSFNINEGLKRITLTANETHVIIG
jgi:hypothetical protein